MNLLKLPLTLLLTLSLLTTTFAGQQKRPTTDKPAAKPAAAPAPAPATFDTLLSAQSYKIYVEVRGVGQLARSSAANDLLDPILKLGGPQKELPDIVNWLKTHADELTTSRLLVAAWPTFTDVPNFVAAIEFSSPEEAGKFESKLNGILPTIFPPVTPESSPEPQKPAQPQQTANEKNPAPEKPKEPALVPGHYVQRSGALLIISDKPLPLKKLRPAGARLLSEDANFRVAYNRFSSDPVFVFVDLKTIEKERNETIRRYREEEKLAEEERKAAAERQKAETPQNPEAGAEGELSDEEKAAQLLQSMPPPESTATPEAPKEPSQAEVVSAALSSMQYSMFMLPADWPDAVGFGFSPDNESFDFRALMIDSAGETSDPVPFFHGLRFGPPIAPDSASILPADSEFVLTMSLDFPQMYQYVSTAPTAPMVLNVVPKTQPSFVPGQTVTPVMQIENALKINIKDELLPLLGSEIAVSLPMSEFNLFGQPPSAPAATKEDGKDPKPAPRTPFVVVSLRDKEGMRRLMPKILEGFAGKAASSMAETERREDTEIVSFADMFAYAFVGNFLVLAGDAATTRRVVDSYLKGETLAADPHFKNSTRWQPRLIQGQVYVSPTLMESYRDWANSSSTRISDEARAFIERLSTNAQPVTYALSNDGMGALHELHLPKGFIVLTAANTTSMENPPETVKNERLAMSALWNISSAERQHRQKNPASYASLEELIAADLVKKEGIETSGYKFELRLTADGFEVSAVPAEYGKSGKLSFFIDQTGMIHGADHSGAAASASDPPVYY